MKASELISKSNMTKHQFFDEVFPQPESSVSEKDFSIDITGEVVELSFEGEVRAKVTFPLVTLETLFAEHREEIERRHLEASKEFAEI